MADRRNLPRVDALSECKELAAYPRVVQVEAARTAIERLRDGATGDPFELAATEAEKLMESRVRRVLNASGVILHTGLGRARLAPSAAEAVAMAAANHINLELDLVTGKRGDRQDHVRDLLTQLTGAEDAFVVQNCAAAVFLVLHAIALRKEVMLSRGQMVEIGGSFRLPDIVKQSGCKLVEIGATNKTRLEDFTRALSPRSKVVLRCHPSNYQVIGFTEEPSAVDLSGFCKANNLILVDDLGSGCLVDTTQYGLPKTPTFMDSVKAGADVVMASGDKLLGGPQSGIIVGDSEVLRRIRKHPLARAVRIDKLSLTALETTLRLYTTGRELEIPTLRYMARKVEEIRTDAEQLQQAYVGGSVIEDGITEIGGGSLPGTGLPTVRVGLLSPRPEKLASALRHGKPPILTRIEKDTVWLDPRTLDTEEVAIAAGLLREAH